MNSYSEISTTSLTLDLFSNSVSSSFFALASSPTCTIVFSSSVLRKSNFHINGGQNIANIKEEVDTSLVFKVPVQTSLKRCWTLLWATNSSWAEQFAKLKQVWRWNCVSSRVIMASVWFAFALAHSLRILIARFLKYLRLKR